MYLIFTNPVLKQQQSSDAECLTQAITLKCRQVCLCTAWITLFIKISDKILVGDQCKLINDIDVLLFLSLQANCKK